MNNFESKPRWVCKEGRRIQRPHIDKFLDELADLCRRYDLTISHEDHHGSFLIQDYSRENIEWILDASDDRGKG